MHSEKWRTLSLTFVTEAVAFTYRCHLGIPLSLSLKLFYYSSRSDTKTTETASEQQAENYTPMDVLLNIQKRLPAKSLCRFKSVSKPWGSMISSPSFLEVHHKKGSQNPNLLFCKVLFLGFEAPKNFLTQWNSFETKGFTLIDNSVTKSDMEYLVISCKGIVSFRGSEKGKQNQIFLYNPSTKYLFALPIDSGKVFSNASISGLGFGYIALSQKFKVLSLFMEINPAPHCKCRIMEISHYDGASRVLIVNILTVLHILG
ncbi:hypothetical protein L6164_001275 [Bauhinia variegata]|uniref:Uncharacterized protein n=1 Tax=Bauhinia variegata TaxID=167791 RepID=A0ACB9Q9C7_BAUVA|nr:hypothetical protein L6164_001275 [Bauhinia variegata]